MSVYRKNVVGMAYRRNLMSSTSVDDAVTKTVEEFTKPLITEVQVMTLMAAFALVLGAWCGTFLTQMRIHQECEKGSQAEISHILLQETMYIDCRVPK